MHCFACSPGCAIKYNWGAFRRKWKISQGWPQLPRNVRKFACNAIGNVFANLANKMTKVYNFKCLIFVVYSFLMCLLAF